jgi:hypothetical protein
VQPSTRSPHPLLPHPLSLHDSPLPVRAQRCCAPASPPAMAPRCQYGRSAAAPLRRPRHDPSLPVRAQRCCAPTSPRRCAPTSPRRCAPTSPRRCAPASPRRPAPSSPLASRLDSAHNNYLLRHKPRSGRIQRPGGQFGGATVAHALNKEHKPGTAANPLSTGKVTRATASPDGRDANGNTQTTSRWRARAARSAAQVVARIEIEPVALRVFRIGRRQSGFDRPAVWRRKISSTAMRDSSIRPISNPTHSHWDRSLQRAAR